MVLIVVITAVVAFAESYIGIDSHFYPLHPDIDLLDKFPEIGLNAFGVEFVIWNIVEPRPPINNVHQYEWG